MKPYYAQKRVPFCAVQWNGDQDTAAVVDLIAPRTAHYDAKTQQLSLTASLYAHIGWWVMRTSEGVSVLRDDVFRGAYEVVAEDGGPVRPTPDEHDVAGREFVQALDTLLVKGLRLSPGEHPSIFCDRNQLLRTLRNLLEDRAYVTSVLERARLLEQIKKEMDRL